MPLVINQGVQDTTQDNKFEPIVAKNVVAQITELKLADSDKMPNTLEVTFRILAGEHKNRFFWDRVTFDPKSQFSWKYRSLRKSAGVPYDEKEPKNIDIEKILLDKAVTVDLGIRKGKNKDGVEQEYQNVVYKILKDKELADTSTVEIDDFVEEEEVVEEKPKTKTKAKAKPKAKEETEATESQEVKESKEEAPVEAIDLTDEDDWS